MKRAVLALLSITHVVNDFYGGVVPGLAPFFVLYRHYSYAAVSGLILASTLLSSVIQPVFGVLADRYRLGWLVSTGMLLSGLGVGLSGLSHSYILTCLAVGISGVGTAAYHPEATRSARYAAGSSAGGMSLFSVGGNVGIALGPVGAALLLHQTGLKGTPLLTVPAILMAITYTAFHLRARKRERRSVVLTAATSRPDQPDGTPRRDDWKSFRILLGIIIARSIGTTGISTFLALFIIQKYHRSAAFGSVALTTLSTAGIAGTLIGGWLADRLGRGRTLQLAYVIAPLALTGVVLSRRLDLAIALIALLGIFSYLPFSVQVTLGQEYLPTRIGTASGVTLGLGITAGGLFSPILGVVADSAGLSTALWIGVAVLLSAFALSLRLSEPKERVPMPQFN